MINCKGFDRMNKTPGQGFEPWRSKAPRALKARALPD